MKFYLLLLLVCVTGMAKATNYYVDPSSTSSTQNGTAAAPWKTLNQVQSAMSSFRAGDIISFKRGQSFSGQITISCSGAAGNPVLFNAYGTGANPLFSGTGSRIDYLIYIQNRSYITIDGITITDPTISQTDRSIQSKIERAFYLDGSTNHVIIQNCNISLVGIGAYFVGGYNTIDHCDMGNLRMVVNNQGGNDDYGANPVVISSANNNITNNYFHDCWATSYDFGYDGGAVELYGPGTDNNRIMYNTMYDCNGLMEVGSGDGGSSNNNIVAYNKLINNESMIYLQNSGSFAISCNNFQFYNNVIVETIVGRLHESRLIGSATTPAAGTLVMKNNVFNLSSGIDVASSSFNSQTHTNNIYKLTNNSVAGLTLGSSEMTTTNAVFTNTASSDPTQWDFMPVSNSPAIDYGQNVGIARDFVGNTVPSTPNSGILENASAPSVLAASSTAGTITCNGGSTTVTVSATGGTAPYTGTGSFTKNAGAYSFTITDAAGATASTSVTITQPTALAATVATTASAATVTASGGTAGYTYSLDGGAYQSGNSFTGMAAGSHTIIILDSKGCSLSKMVTIAGAQTLTASSTAGTIACNGGSTTVTVNASGGSAPYTGTGNFTKTAGSYNFTVTDATGATATTSVTVAQPSALSVVVAAGNVTIALPTTIATITATGGTPGYTYQLDAGSFQSSNIFPAVVEGNHSITVKDGRGCTATKSFSVIKTISAPLVISAVAGTIACNGNTTSVTMSATGGVAPYTGTGTFTVAAGTYTYTITDANGTTGTTSVTVTQPSAIGVTVTSGTIATNGGTTSITVSATGGSGSFTYKLNSGSYQSSNTFSNVAAGTHTITVKDKSGCTAVKSITITQPAAGGVLQLTLVAKTDVTCRGRRNGTIRVQATGGTAPYLYKIPFIPYSSNNYFTNLSSGSYLVKVKDATGAIASLNVTILGSNISCGGNLRSSEFPEEEATKINSGLDIQINAYPNPSASAFNLTVTGNQGGDVLVEVMDLNGRKIYQAKGAIDKKYIFGQEFMSGTYFVRVIQGNIAKTQKIIKIK